MLFKKGECIDLYSVVLPLYRGDATELYRARGLDGQMFLIKIYRPDKLSPCEYSFSGRIREVEMFDMLRCEGISRYISSGTIHRDGGRYPYVVLEFVPGEFLVDRLEREPFRLYSDVVGLTVALLKIVKSLHLHPETIVCNGITPKNILLDARSEDHPKPVLTSLESAVGVSSYNHGYGPSTPKTPPVYLANEALQQGASTKSDLFSVGVILYQILYRRLPWTIDADVELGSQQERQLWFEVRSKRLSFPDVSEQIIGYDPKVELIVKKALSPDLELRFGSADEFIAALLGETEVVDIDRVQQEESVPKARPIPQSIISRGKGFAAVAGLRTLKEKLQREVIDALRSPEVYAQYGVSIPNGMLLYGPPGCGKTFFAKRFAEEVGFNFMLMTPAMLKSRYVNATQENIANMFAEAAENAPTIIFIDEINELLPNREADVHEMSRSAVNEMLAQMDRTGDKGIFVIGATNYPQQIDTAMLRSGRLECKVYLPAPDVEVREELFRMYLEGRPLELGINYEELVALTEGYVSADIERLVNDAARRALIERVRIGLVHLKQAISDNKPSLSKAELDRYEKIRQEVEQESQPTSRKKIGYN
ncbi:AAA family ATPase [Porphyromonas sp. COT-290 OH3588]|uniref:AAA family ATPase n=1 Tax=Porphyromonas sp. COT-290 OH3588 TaxID=1515617 RepID=UPI00052C171E|nr:AAA family ATPase [Porphyromonas sp. COT-290 OH3588]KGN98307.1 hypothetical protein HQ48_07840 [Porphyromonas sp. COT-290 OH3588]